jgi:general secretion pathway protein G
MHPLLTASGRVDANPPINRPINDPISRLPNHPMRGFTLIELLVVLTLITTLSAIGMAQYSRSITYAREATLKEDLFRMRDAIDQYYADKNQYPATLDALVSEGYLRRIPEDPFTKSADSWQTVPAEPDPSNPSAEVGIYDVKSGSDQTALDGRAYSEF